MIKLRLTVKSLCKSFSLPDGRKKQALDDVSFTAQSGEPLGLLGRNGAGKTTAMRIIMGVFPPDSGEVLIDGEPVSRKDISFGYLPEERGLYRKLTVSEQMVYFGRLRGLSKAAAKRSTEELLERLDMKEYAKNKLETLSKGNQQKIQLGTALLGDPDVIILDEPFSGLDPVNAMQLKQVIEEQSQKGALIIFSSHQMSAVEDFCENIVMLNKGRKVLDGNLSQIKRAYPRNRVRIVLDDENGDGAVYKESKFLQAAAASGEIEITKKGAIISLFEGIDAGRAMCRMLYTGLPVLDAQVMEPALEDIFVEMAGSAEEVQDR